MNLSLYQRLGISLAVLFALLFAGFVLWTNHVDEQATQAAEQRLHLNLAQHLVNDNPRVSQGFYDYEDLANLFHTMMVLGPAFEFYLLDPTGKILTYSAPKEKIKRDAVDLVPVLNLLKDPGLLPVTGDDPRHPDRRKIFSAAPVNGEDGLKGYLYVIIRSEQYDSAFAAAHDDKQQHQSLLVIGSAIIFLFVVLLVLLRVFTSPVRQLSRAMEAFQAADFDLKTLEKTAQLARLPVLDNLLNQHPHKAARHEIGQLTDVFTQMAKRINAQISQLKANDTQRRELLAQLSHDLRTPLAALQGYLETLDIKQDKIDDADRAQFIHIALRNSLVLKRLVDQIFELAHLESGQVNVELEVFPVAELIHDIAAKFTLKAEKQGVKLVLPPTPCLQQVSADIGKLERVLTNLIENALRHTPKGGEIQLQVETTYDNRLMISVKDTGSGIPKNDLPYIFDARYRGANASGDRHQHAGFGLAICKRLLALLNTELAVSSEYGHGATFSFCVPLVDI